VTTHDQTRGQQREENANHRKKSDFDIIKKSMSPLTLSKDVLRERKRHNNL
jgi:hypothetical protein